MLVTAVPRFGQWGQGTFGQVIGPQIAHGGLAQVDPSQIHAGQIGTGQVCGGSQESSPTIDHLHNATPFVR